jgi:hypothetical protein
MNAQRNARRCGGHNKALEPTAYSFGFAYASGGGSPPALGADYTLHGPIPTLVSPAANLAAMLYP